ncbi:phosphopantetheine-binding protein, partial [Pseudoalteromonas piscicida]|uniref:phosphopantetheine-binding protein n=2 Tax=Pseudoalteromonas piscicida TaxID=43662 RepID=UPI00110A4313
DYMVPAAFVVLEALPLTVNGKLNRHALPEPDLDKFTAEYSAPQTETEKTLALIWQQLLGIASVGLGDNFFDLGGHSLLAIKLAARCGEAFEVTLPLREIFNQ